MLLGAITLFALFGKYSGFYPQLNKFISLIISILITKLAFYKLIGAMIPFVGLSAFTRPLVFYLSVLSFYIISQSILGIILFRYEPSNKNYFAHSTFGFLFGGLNGFMILALIVSVIFSVFSVNNQILLKLNESIIFMYLYNINTIFLSYA